jgi:hypothetical protein
MPLKYRFLLRIFTKCGIPVVLGLIAVPVARVVAAVVPVPIVADKVP